MGGMDVGAGGGSLPVRGIAWGVLAVLAWAVYNVGAKVGAAQGFRAPDLTVLRFGVAGLIMLPMLLRMGLRDLGGLGWPRGLALLLAAGPLFGLCVEHRLRPGPAGAWGGARAGLHHAGGRRARLVGGGRAAERRPALRHRHPALGPARHRRGRARCRHGRAGVAWATSPSPPPASCGAPSPSCSGAGAWTRSMPRPWLPCSPRWCWCRATWRSWRCRPCRPVPWPSRRSCRVRWADAWACLPTVLPSARLGAGRAALFPACVPALATLLADAGPGAGAGRPPDCRDRALHAGPGHRSRHSGRAAAFRRRHANRLSRAALRPPAPTPPCRGRGS